MLYGRYTECSIRFLVFVRMKQHECWDSQWQHIIAITKQSKITTKRAFSLAGIYQWTAAAIVMVKSPFHLWKIPSSTLIVDDERTRTLWIMVVCRATDGYICIRPVPYLTVSHEGKRGVWQGDIFLIISVSGTCMKPSLIIKQH